MTHFKICGLKRFEDLKAARNAGASYGGLVFFPPSPRHINLSQMETLAQESRSQLPPTSEFKLVVLTVNPSDDLLNEIVTRVQADVLQLHGDEPPARVKQIKDQVQKPIIKALPIAQKSDVAKATEYLPFFEQDDLILFDAKADPARTQLPGGNGLSFDWTLLKGQAEQRPFMLAGGLTPHNVGTAITQTKAAFVDVSSGVEHEPGQKDPQLIDAFAKACQTNS